MNVILMSINDNQKTLSSVKNYFSKKEENQKCPILRLEPNLLVKILSFLTTEEIVKTSFVSRKFKNLQTEPFLWKVLIEKFYPDIPLTTFLCLSLNDRKNFAQSAILMAKFEKKSARLKKDEEIAKVMLVVAGVSLLPTALPIAWNGLKVIGNGLKVCKEALDAHYETTLAWYAQEYRLAHPEVTDAEARAAVIALWKAASDSINY